MTKGKRNRGNARLKMFTFKVNIILTKCPIFENHRFIVNSQNKRKAKYLILIGVLLGVPKFTNRSSERTP